MLFIHQWTQWHFSHVHPQKELNDTIQSFLRSYINTHLTETHKQSHKFTIRSFCIFSRWTIYTINSDCGHNFCTWVLQPVFQKRLGGPGPALPHKHIPRERTHGAKCWNILHICCLDLVTSGTPLKTVSDLYVFIQAPENQNVPQHMSVSHKTSIFRELGLLDWKRGFVRLHFA